MCLQDFFKTFLFCKIATANAVVAHSSSQRQQKETQHLFPSQQGQRRITVFTGQKIKLTRCKKVFKNKVWLLIRVNISSIYFIMSFCKLFLLYSFLFTDENDEKSSWEV